MNDSSENSTQDLCVRSRSHQEGQEPDMTPMVDVTFLLLIFFMVTASFSLQKSIPMPRAQSELPSDKPDDVPPRELVTVTVEIDEFNGYLVIAKDFEHQTTGKLAVTAKLKQAVDPSAAGMRLAIVCHERAKLQCLVDVMDAGTIAAYDELQITEVEELN